MNYVIPAVFISMIGTVCASTTPGDIATTITNRIKGSVNELHTQLVGTLKERKKNANKQRQLECDTQKKALQKDCAQDKQERSTFYKQITRDLRTAKKKVGTKGQNLGGLFESAQGYVTLLREHAESAQLKGLVKDLKKEADWLEKLHKTTAKSKIALDEKVSASSNKKTAR